jgi:hypothetical protein
VKSGEVNNSPSGRSLRLDAIEQPTSRSLRLIYIDGISGWFDHQLRDVLLLFLLFDSILDFGTLWLLLLASQFFSIFDLSLSLKRSFFIVHQQPYFHFSSALNQQRSCCLPFSLPLLTF